MAAVAPPGDTARARQVAAQADALAARIRAAGRDPDTVTVVAVTKGFGPDTVRTALAAGLVDVGENYAQELVAKAGALTGPLGPARPRWHFIGGLQRNKVRHLAPHVALWQSVDRPEVGAEIARWAPGAAVLVEVDLGGGEHRPGCTADDAPELSRSLRDLGLDVRGLMGVAPEGPPETARPGFRRLAGLARDLGLGTVSMGMSGDLEVALEEGSTMLRVGTALFGPRHPRAAARG